MRSRLNASKWLIVLVVLGMGCTTSTDSTPTLTPTPWPTLSPVETLAPDAIPDFIAEQTGDPVLVEQYRVELSEGVVSVFPLAGQVRTPVRIEVIVLDGTPDPALQIRNATGSEIARANSNGTGEPEVIGQFQFPGNGFYELGISTEAAGGVVGVSIYELARADIENSGVFVSTDETLQATMEHPLTYHTYRLPLERGQRIDLNAIAESEGLDLVFNIYNPAGTLVSSRDDVLDKDPYLWNFMPNQTGEYTVVVTNFDENVGDYTLTVTPSTGAGEAEIGTRGDLTLQGTPRLTTWMTLQGQALEGFNMEVRPVDSGLDIGIVVYDPYGNRIAEMNAQGTGGEEALTLVQFPFDGTYQIEIFTIGAGGTVDYLIRRERLVDIGMGGRLIPSPFDHEGEIEGAGSYVTYVFDGNIGDLVGISVAAEGLNTTLDLAFDLYDPEGYYVLTRDDVVGLNPVIDRYELQKQGRYVIIVRNLAGNSGPFELFLTDPRGPDSSP